MMARFRRELSQEVQLALAAADQLMASDRSGNIHSVGFGDQTVNGCRVGESIVITVQLKGERALRDLDTPTVPYHIRQCFTDVQEQPLQNVQVLHVDERYRIQSFSDDASVHRKCYDTPIPGGVEIFPVGKQWLGTLGCRVQARNSSGEPFWGAITNWHVATGTVNQTLGQPGGNDEVFASVAQSPGVKFTGYNYVDLSVLYIERTDGKYAPLTHTVKAEQVTLGQYSEELSTGGVGTKVARDGRTLGRVTDGRVSQIGATVRVGYSAGKVATFKDQFVISRQDGDFSAPGDSGSMVFDYPDMRPFGLLFAGGGGTTIVSPAEFVLEYGNVVSFK